MQIYINVNISTKIESELIYFTSFSKENHYEWRTITRANALCASASGDAGVLYAKRMTNDEWWTMIDAWWTANDEWWMTFRYRVSFSWCCHISTPVTSPYSLKKRGRIACTIQIYYPFFLLTDQNSMKSKAPHENGWIRHQSLGWRVGWIPSHFTET